MQVAAPVKLQATRRRIMTTQIIKLCPKLIIEGTRLTGKTDLALALNEHPRIVGVRKYRYHSPIVSAEWNGFVKNPYGSSLIDFDEAYEGYALKAYRTWLSLFELYRYYSWIIDRFHISTQMWQAAYRGKKYQFGWLESRLSALGFRLIFCWRNPKSFADARTRRLRISSNPSQYDDLGIFLREQEIFEQLVEKSAIPKLLVDVTESSIGEQIDYIAGWLEATGGLNPVESPPNRKMTLNARLPVDLAKPKKNARSGAKLATNNTQSKKAASSARGTLSKRKKGTSHGKRNSVPAQ